jgi:hypothetical protein
VLNLFDVTRGNYRVARAISYPTLPNSRVVLDVKVKALSASEWVTEIHVAGTYDGPNDIVANEDYELAWRADETRLLEQGRVTLLRASGQSLEQAWTSIITPEGRPDRLSATFRKFPKDGELVTASVSPFKLKKGAMSYTWDGVVSRRRASR